MRSVCISYNFSTRSIFDAYEPNNEQDITRFRDRVAQDRTASPDFNPHTREGCDV